MRITHDGAEGHRLAAQGRFTISTNFRGFPHVPGNDFMLSVATRQGKNDGKSRFS
jgi:hypothetical protein